MAVRRFGLDVGRQRGAAQQASQQPSWRDYLDGGAGGSDPMAPEPGSPEDILRRAQSRQQSTEDLHQAVGAPGDSSGEAPSGLLTTALEWLDRPKSTVAGLVTGLAGESDEDQHFTDPLMGGVERAARGFATDESYSIRELLPETGDDDSLWERAMYGTAGFLGDVAVDPLTYVSFGGSVIGKKLATEAVANQARSRAARELGDEGLEKWARESTRHKAHRQVAEGAEEAGDAATAQAARRAGDDALKAPASWKGTEQEWMRDVGARQFSAAAAESYQRGGTTGLRRWARETLGDEKGERFFDALPRDVKGGVRVRMPFHRDAATRTPGAAGVGGGGRLLEKIGLDDAAIKSHEMRNRLRASTVGRGVADKLTGKEGELYGDMVRNLVAKQGEDLSGATYAQYQGVKRARKVAQQAGYEVRQETLDNAVGPADSIVKDAPDPEAAQEAFERWWNDPKAVDEQLRGSTVERGADGIRGSGPALDGMDANERAGATAALFAHDYLRQMLTRLRDAGLSVDELNDYIPRVMTKSERLKRSAESPVKPSQGRRGGQPGYDPRSTRRQYVEATVVEGEDGLPSVEFRHLSPSEIEEASGRAVFETDPVAALAGYGDAVGRLTTRARFANMLHEQGILAEGSSQYKRILGGRHVEELGEEWQKGVASHQRLLEDASERARADKAAAQAKQRAARERASERRQQADEAAAERRRVESEPEIRVDDDVMPPVPEGHVRMFRGESPEQIDADLSDELAERRGRYFTPSRESAQQYADGLAEAGHEARLMYVDVPEDVARQSGDDPMAVLRSLAADSDEVILPDELARQARPVGAGDAPAPRSLDEVGGIPVFHGTVGQIDHPGSIARHGGIHVGSSRRAAEDALENQRTILSSPRVDVDTEGMVPNPRIIEGRLAADRVLGAEQPLDENELRRTLESEGRDALAEQYDAIAYINEAEATGEVSYLVLNREALTTSEDLATSPLAFRREDYARKVGTERVEEAEAQLAERAAAERGEEARQAYNAAQSRHTFERDTADLLVDVDAARTLRLLFDDDGVMGSPGQGVVDDEFLPPGHVDTEGELVEILEGALGWQRTTRRMDPDEAAEFYQTPASRLSERDLTVETLEPPDDETLDHVRRVVWQRVRERGAQMPDDEWQARVEPLVRQLGSPEGRRRGVHVQNLPSDPDDLAAWARLVDELDGAGWHVSSETPYQRAGQTVRQGGWYIRNRRQGESYADIAARETAAVQRLRELGFDVGDAPPARTQSLSEKQAEVVGRFAGDDVRIDRTAERRRAAPRSEQRKREQQLRKEGVDPALVEQAAKDRVGGKPQIVGESNALRRLADSIEEGLEGLSKNERQAGKAAVARLRKAADEFDDAVSRVGPADRGVVRRDVRRPISEPQLADFERSTPSLTGDERRAVSTEAKQAARREWEDALRGHVLAGGSVSREALEQLPKRSRERIEAAVRGQRQPEVRRLEKARKAAERDVENAGADELAAMRREAEADAYLAELDRELEKVYTDRSTLSRTIEQLMSTEDVDSQFEQLDTLMDGLLEFHRRHADRLEKELGRVGKESERTLKEARKELRQRINATKRAGGEAKRGRETLDEASTALSEGAGLRQIGQVGELGSGMPDVNLPPELSLSFAPEMARKAIEKYYRASKPGGDGALEKFLENVYRPYFLGFKSQATIGRGPGYHARNTIGGMWNNWLRDVTVNDHRMSERLVRARIGAHRQALKEQAEKIAKRRGISVKEARQEVPRADMAMRADELLYKKLKDVEVAEGVTLYDVHQASLQEEIGFKDSRIFESLHGQLGRQDPGAQTSYQAHRLSYGATQDPPIQMFKSTDPEDLNKAQRAMNKSVDWWWMHSMKDLAMVSEDYIRHAAFVRGARDYGLGDGGETAALLSRALHFDYQDLSDFEQKWMRGTFIPFYVWTRHNIPLQMRALAKEPGKMHRLGMARDAAEDVFGEDEAGVVPDWMQEKLGFVSNIAFKNNPIVMGVESPAYDLNRFLRVPDGASWQDISGAAGRTMSAGLGMVSPVFKVPVEQMLQYDTFTGAKYNPRGVEAPAWYRALPGAPTREDDQGRVRAPTSAVKAVHNTIPWIGQSSRLLPTTEATQARWPTSWAATLAAAPASTLTPQQHAGELRSRSDRLRSRIDWHADESEVEEAKALLEQGYSPDQVRAILGGG